MKQDEYYLESDLLNLAFDVDNTSIFFSGNNKCLQLYAERSVILKTLRKYSR